MNFNLFLPCHSTRFWSWKQICQTPLCSPSLLMTTTVGKKGCSLTGSSTLHHLHLVVRTRKALSTSTPKPEKFSPLMDWITSRAGPTSLKCKFVIGRERHVTKFKFQYRFFPWTSTHPGSCR